MRIERSAGAAAILFLFCAYAHAADVRTTAKEIREEAVRANDDPGGRPLPLMASWTCGHFTSDRSAGWRPANQMRLIEAGHHLLPWFNHPGGAVSADPNDFAVRYFKEPILRARELKLPLTFVASQWESGLSGKPYIDLPAERNPNVVTADGKIQPRVSPFGPVEPWREIGATHTANAWMKQIQEWYPDPPLVIFLSNNEHAKLRWSEAETDRRYVEKFGTGRDAEFKRAAVADGWIVRYRALQDGLRRGLVNETWRKNSIYIGYDAFGPPHFGRWGGWIEHSQYVKGRIDPGPLTWDGGSPSYYTDDWNPRSDYTVWSPQVEFMNLVFMQREAMKLNPRFWFEFSVWDGYHEDAERQKRYPSKRSVYRKAGQTYDPERYAGSTQFGMWLMRPRAVRDFRGWTEPWDDVTGPESRVVYEGGGPYFLALARAVDRVHANPVLREWWRKGELVPNRARAHLYQAAVPPEYVQADRWFMLDTALDPAQPWNLGTQVPVFALALAQGKAPARRWLVYAHSPLADRTGVAVTIPEYGPVTMDVARGGSFLLVDEKTKAARPVR